MKEIIEMAQFLSKLRTDTYMKYKYMLLSVSRERQGVHNLIKVLFDFTDTCRPLLIEMKEGGTA